MRATFSLNVILTSEYHTNILLGIIFTLIGLVAGYRLVSIWRDGKNSKVFTIFNGCILLCSVIRAIWLFIPETTYETLFTDEPIVAHSQSNWVSLLVSQILLSYGNIFFIAVFVLLGIYWTHLMHKMTSEASPLPSSKPSVIQYSPVNSFYLFLVLMVLCQFLDTFLFLRKTFNSYIMVLYDCALFDILSIGILFWFWIVTHRVRKALEGTSTSESPFSSQSQAAIAVQIRRLTTIAFGANVFLVYRVASQTALCLLLVACVRDNTPFSDIMVDYYWSWFVGLQFVSEITVLLLQLLVSTPVKAHVTQRSSSFQLRRIPSAKSSSGGYASRSNSLNNNNNINSATAAGTRVKLSETTPLVGL